MQHTRTWAHQRLDAIETRPDMWGNPAMVEGSYFTVLEMLVRDNPSRLTEARREASTEHFGGSKLALHLYADNDMDKLVKVLKDIRKMLFGETQVAKPVPDDHTVSYDEGEGVVYRLRAYPHNDPGKVGVLSIEDEVWVLNSGVWVLDDESLYAIHLTKEEAARMSELLAEGVS